MVEQLGWRAPKAVLCPVGSGSILMGLFDGFLQLFRNGIIDRIPKLIAIQATNVSPIFDAWKNKSNRINRTYNCKPTIARNSASYPIRDRRILIALRKSQGMVIRVSEKDIKNGMLALGKEVFYIEPTSAVIWRGLSNIMRKKTTWKQ